MSICKLFCSAILAAIAAFVAEGLNVRINGLDLPNSHPHDPVLGPDASLWSMRHSINPLIGQTVLLPIQSKSDKDLSAGKLLVASRGLTDPNFAKTVILFVHYGADGVIGLMLNRRTDVPLSRVLEGLKAAKGRSDPVYLGGPVKTPAVFALLQSPAKVEGAEHIFGSVYLISTKTLFEQTVSKQPDPRAFYVYLGYAGWNMSQLRKEVELGAWFIFQGDTETVFDLQPDSLWPRMIEKTELQLAHKPFCKVGPKGDPGIGIFGNSVVPSRHRNPLRFQESRFTHLNQARWVRKLAAQWLQAFGSSQRPSDANPLSTRGPHAAHALRSTLPVFAGFRSCLLHLALAATANTSGAGIARSGDRSQLLRA